MQQLPINQHMNFLFLTKASSAQSESGDPIHSASDPTSCVSLDKSLHLLDLYQEDGNKFFLYFFLSSEFLNRKETLPKRPFKNTIQPQLPKYITFINQTVQNFEEKRFSGNFFSSIGLLPPPHADFSTDNHTHLPTR